MPPRSTEPSLPALHPAGEELNLRILGPLLGYLEAHQGAGARQAVLAAARVHSTAEKVADRWVSHAQFERILSEARALLASDAEFKAACCHEIRHHYGPLLLVFTFSSMDRIFDAFDRTSHFVTRISRFEVVSRRPRGTVTVRYHSRYPESRLACLSRQAQWEAIPPLLWKQPPAEIHERRCLAWGDDCCEVTLRWREPLRFGLPALGALVGGGGGAALLALGLSFWALPALISVGTLAGLGASWRRAERDRMDYLQAKALEVERFMDAHVEVTQALLELHQRQERWTAQVERQSLTSAHTLEKVLGRLEDLRATPPRALQDLSHDLRNPLTLIRASASALADAVKEGAAPPLLERYVAHIQTGADRLGSLIDELREVTAHQASDPESDPPRPLRIAPLRARIQNQLQALTAGRDLRVGVTTTREMPPEIETRTAVFDRILDNLLTNAAKYTARGAILVELGGTPGHLCIKVSDTGCGIAPERMEAVLTGAATGAEESDRASQPLVGDRRGLGLSVAVRLVDRLGGRLEVLSRPEMGTTFWVYVPTRQAGAPARPRADEPIARVVERVVTVRSGHTDPTDLLH